MDIHTRKKGDVVIIDIKGEVDLYTSPAVRNTLSTLIKKKHKAILVNFKGVRYIDSSGLATLIEAIQKMRPYGGRLGLWGLNQSIRGIFEISKLEDIFAIFKDEEQAIAGLG
jgi:anti-sigma B factor antagonist